MVKTTNWLKELDQELPNFLHNLQTTSPPGKFLPCVEGVTDLGRQLTLGFTCFGAKLYSMLGLWEELAEADRRAWVDLIKSFQIEGNLTEYETTRNAFLDPPEIIYLSTKKTSFRQLARQMVQHNRKKFDPINKIKLIASSWSANLRKGFDIYRYLDENLDFLKYEMTFVGNSQVEFKDIKWIKSVSSEKIAKILKNHDISIVSD